MRLLKGQNTNSRNIYGRGLQVDTLDQVIADSTNSIRIPYGTTSQRPTTPTNGQLRYNSTLNKFEGNEVKLSKEPLMKNSKNHSIPLPPLKPGIYNFKWRAMSEDGHIIKGKSNFKLE